MEKDKKPKPLFLIFGFLLAFLLGMGVMYLWQNYPSLKPQPSIQPTARVSPSPIVEPSLGPEIPTDWKTYRRKEWSYEISYPESWHLRSENIDTVLANKLVDPSEPVSPQTQDKTIFVVKISIFDKDSSISLGDWIDSDVWRPKLEQEIAIIKEPKPRKTAITIGNISGYRLEYGSDKFPMVHVFLEKDKNKVYKISANLDYPGEEELFNKILSTFEFIKQSVNNDVKNWITATHILACYPYF